MSKVGIPSGTRDFGPKEMARRNYIFSVIRDFFHLYGFSQIETPAMENITTLTGKYGEEGDQLIFKILNSRMYDSKKKEELKKEFDLSLEGPRNSELLTERALRYDLTVPFARYVVMHRNEITFPFKRYQIQPVWRADKPQKGRYREFFQCDADIIGSNSLLNELELIRMMDDVFGKLKLPVLIKMNNRKILSGIAEVIGEKEKIVDITVAIDKLDKIGLDAVLLELRANEISDSAIEKLKPLFSISGNNHERLNGLKDYLKDSEIGQKGIEEIAYVLNEISRNVLSSAEFEIDITLARGLNYYTGSIFEVKTAAGAFKSSILGGGRYDDLTGIFGLPGLSGVGISFGIDRIYDVMEELQLFNEVQSSLNNTQVLFANFGKSEELVCLDLANSLRKAGIRCEVYPDQTKKMSKQFDYATAKGIPLMCFVGSEEINSGIYQLKDLSSGVQHKLNLEELIHFFQQ